MAKNKSKSVEPIEATEEIIEEIVAEEVAVEPTAEDRYTAFVDRKLKAINAMENKAKAERLANRLLRKRKG